MFELLRLAPRINRCAIYLLSVYIALARLNTREWIPIDLRYLCASNSCGGKIDYKFTDMSSIIDAMLYRALPLHISRSQMTEAAALAAAAAPA